MSSITGEGFAASRRVALSLAAIMAFSPTAAALAQPKPHIGTAMTYECRTPEAVTEGIIQRCFQHINGKLTKRDSTTTRTVHAADNAAYSDIVSQKRTTKYEDGRSVALEVSPVKLLARHNPDGSITINTADSGTARVPASATSEAPAADKSEGEEDGPTYCYNTLTGDSGECSPAQQDASNDCVAADPQHNVWLFRDGNSNDGYCEAVQPITDVPSNDNPGASDKLLAIHA